VLSGADTLGLFMARMPQENDQILHTHCILLGPAGKYSVFFMSSDQREKTGLGQKTDNSQCISVSCDWPSGIGEIHVVPLFHRR
jgi:hypothetical protein